MLRLSFYDLSFFDVDPDALGLAPDAFERWLPIVLPRIVQPEDFDGFYADDALGAPTCCPFVLTGMLLLQYRYDVSDAVLVQRCRRDLGWKHAVGLALDDKPPSVSSVKRHRAKLRKLLGDDFLHLRMLAVAVEDELLTDADLQGIDSTNTDCRGAVIDTFNLIAAGIRQVIRTVARSLGESAERLARRWEMTRYLARSIKGGARIDWTDPEARSALLTEEIRDADRVARLVAELGVVLPPDVDEAVALLGKVAHQDVEESPDGGYRIARGTAPGRVISITDPEARHGRKSSSKVINGFKTHVAGTLVSQFVTGIANTDASVHDAEATPALIEQTKKANLLPAELVGDGAYGTGANRRACADDHVELHAKLPAPNRRSAFPKVDWRSAEPTWAFGSDIDLQRMEVTCPRGHTTKRYTRVKDPAGSGAKVERFHFDRQRCNACDQRQACCAKTARGGSRTITLSVYEPELQRAKAFNRSDRAEGVLRGRSAIERLLSHLIRMGMRHARFFGLFATQLQAFMTAAAYNMQRYITLLVARGGAAPT